MAINLISLDEGAFYFNIGSTAFAEAKVIVINPVLTTLQARQVLEKQSIHYVLITHLYDQWEDSLRLLESNPSATLVAQPALVNFLKARAKEFTLNAITMEPGNELDFPWAGTPDSDSIGSLVMTTNTVYGEGDLLTIPDSNETYEANGYILNAEGHQIYYSGICPFNSELRSIGLIYKPDISILLFSKDLGYETTQDISRAVMWLGSDIVLPVDVSEKENPSYEAGEIYDSIDIFTPAICRSLSPGQCYTIEPTTSSGGFLGSET